MFGILALAVVSFLLVISFYFGMQIVRDAYRELTGKEMPFSAEISYGRLHNYNANVKRMGDRLVFSFSKNWKDVDDDIKAGLIQELLCKVLKLKRVTRRMEMYKIFIKKLAKVTPRTHTDPLLEESFYRVNERYFNGSLDIPNLAWGGENVRTVGTYNFHTDRVTISGLLRDAEPDILDYVMYHELLHKKLQFDHKKQRMQHHTREFRQKEEAFEDSLEMEKRLDKFLRKKRFPLF